MKAYKISIVSKESQVEVILTKSSCPEAPITLAKFQSIQMANTYILRLKNSLGE